jgi:hypothetical protein
MREQTNLQKAEELIEQLNKPFQIRSIIFHKIQSLKEKIESEGLGCGIRFNQPNILICGAYNSLKEEINLCPKCQDNQEALKLLNDVLR